MKISEMTILRKIYVYSILIFIAVNCLSQEYKIDFKSFSDSNKNQKFTVIPAYYNMKIFAEEAQKNSNRTNELYGNLIYQPIYDKYVAKGEYSEIMNTLKQPITNIKALQEEIYLLESSDIIQFVLDRLKTISDTLAGPDTNIILLAMNPDNKDLYKKYNLGFMYTGVTAITTGTGNIIISIDPREDKWQNILEYVIAHEYHHSVWTSRNFQRKDFSIIEYLIFEGRADFFANIIFPDIEIPWIRNLSAVKEKEVWNIIKDVLESRDEDLNTKIMVGDEKIPYGSGYSIGYHIVSNYMMSNPKSSIVELTDMNPQEVLKRSKYQIYMDSIK